VKKDSEAVAQKAANLGTSKGHPQKLPLLPKPPQLQDEEVDNFMKLATAVKIILAPLLTDDDLMKAYGHLTEYLLQFKVISDIYLIFLVLNTDCHIEALPR
jgi:hypothetical protein